MLRNQDQIIRMKFDLYNKVYIQLTDPLNSDFWRELYVELWNDMRPQLWEEIRHIIQVDLC